MAQIHWAGGNGLFSDAANWVGGGVPGASDGAILDAPPFFTVTSNISETVRSIQTVAGATLDITGGTFLARVGVGAGANAGEIQVGANAALVIGGGGTFANTGAIVLGVAGEKASLIFNRSTTLTPATGGAMSGSIVLFGDATISGARSNVILTNDEVIEGAGKLGDGKLTLINGATGFFALILAEGGLLTINTGHNTITNRSVIEATPGSQCVITSAVDNTGVLEVFGGRSTAFMKVEGAVTGSGSASIFHGTLDFTSSFDENVAFAPGDRPAKLELAQSQTYTGSISGFSKTGETSLDLVDIGFVSSAEASFSGTTSSGVLTVTDGSHTAHINLIGDYTGSTFAAKSDGHGGTIVIDPQANPAHATAHLFIAAMAGLGGSAGGATHSGAQWPAHSPMLARPRAMTA